MTEHAHGSDDHGSDEAYDHGHDHDESTGHDHSNGRLRRLAERFVGHSHDPGDSIDDALTSSARGIRALKVHAGADAHALTRHHDQAASGAS